MIDTTKSLGIYDGKAEGVGIWTVKGIDIDGILHPVDNTDYSVDAELLTPGLTPIGLTFQFHGGGLQQVQVASLAGNSFTLFGAQVAIASATIIPDRNPNDTDPWDPEFRLQGSITLPPALGSSQITLQDSNYLLVNETGLGLSGGEISIPNLDFNLGLFQVHGSGIHLKYVKDQSASYFEIQGAVSIPSFYNLTANFSEPNYIKINSDGSVQVVGSVSADNITLFSGVSIKHAEVSFDTTVPNQTKVTANATIDIPSGLELGATVHWNGNQLDAIDISADNLINKPIGSTGAYLKNIHGGYANKNNQFDFHGGVVITAGPTISYLPLPGFLGGDIYNKSLITATLDATITSDYLDATGHLTVLNDAILFADGEIKINWLHNYFFAHANLNILSGLIKANADVIGRSYGNNQFDFYALADGSINIPTFIPLIGGLTLGGGGAYFQYIDDNNSSDDFVEAWGSTFFGTIGFKFAFDGSVSLFGQSEVNAAHANIDAVRGGLDLPYKQVAIQAGTANTGATNFLTGVDAINGYSKTIQGSAGNDILKPDLGQGNEILDGGDGIDTADYSGNTAQQGIIASLSFHLDNLRANGYATNDGTGSHDKLISIENITGGAGNDQIIGDGRANVLIGGSGNDTLIGNGDESDVNFVTFGTGIGAINYFLTGQQGWQDNNQMPRRLADVNGDGRADIVGFGGNSVYVALGQSDGTFGNAHGTISYFLTGQQGWQDNNQMPRLMGDVNGDGRADIVGFGGNAVYVALGQSDGTFSNAFPVVLNTYVTGQNGWQDNSQMPRLLGDVNGDGRADIVGFGGNSVYVALGQSNGTFSNAFTATQNSGNFAINGKDGWGTFETNPRLLGDVNGDGRADIVAFGGNAIYVALGQSDGTFSYPFPAIQPDIQNFFLTGQDGWQGFNQMPRQLADINGDGRADIVAFGGNAVFIALGQSDGTFGTILDATKSFITGQNGWQDNTQMPRQLADVNGDGRADIVGFGGNSVYVALAEKLKDGNDTLIGGTGDDTLRGSAGDDILIGGQYVLSQAGTWDQAQAEAQSLGGNLVTIHSQAENNLLVSLFGGTEHLWIGSTDRDVEGTFKWVSGETSTYTNWAPGEPNNFIDAGVPQNYAYINDGAGLWDDTQNKYVQRGIIALNGGNNTLIGGAGNDTLVGGNGADTFVFNSLNDGIDTIVDFSHTQRDKIQISDAFLNGNSIASFNYNANTGALSYQGQTFAVLNTNSGFTYADIIRTSPLKLVALSVALTSDTGISNTDLVTNNGALTFTGIDVNNNAIVQYWDGRTWIDNYTPVEGRNFVEVRQTVNSVSSSSTLFEFTLDTIAPLPSLVGLLNDTGISNTDNITSDGTIFQSQEPNAIVQYSTNGGTTWTNSFTATEGANTVQVRQTDRAGNVSTPTALTFILDTIVLTAPAVALTIDTGISSSDLITSNGALTITGIKSGATAQYSTDNGQTWINSFTPAQGLNSVLVRQTTASDASSSTLLSFTLDTIAPTAPTAALTSDTGTSSNDGITKVSTLNLTGTEPTALVEYSINSGTTWTTSFAATEGLNTIQVRQTDVAGNVSIPTSLSFTLDTVALAPTVALTSDTGVSNSDKITKVGTLNLTGTETNALVEYSINGGTTWTTSFAATEGLNTVQIRQTDGAGNISTPTSLSFTLDTLVSTPTLALAVDAGSSNSDKLTNSGIVNVSGLETGASWQYSTNNGTNWIDGTGTSFTLTGDGAKSVIVRQTDLAGNASNPSTAFTFTLDTAAPTTTATITSMTKDTGTSATDFITSDGTAGRTYSGTISAALVTASESLQVSIDGGTTWSNATVNNKAWTFTDNIAKSGNWTIQARVADTAGNGGTIASKAVTLNQQISAIALDLTDASDKGFSATDNLTNVQKPTFAVTFDSTKANVGDLVQVLNSNNIIFGSTTLTAVQASAGTVNVVLSVALSSGTNLLSAFYRDRAGNTITSASPLAVTYDGQISAASAVTLDLLAASDSGVSSTDNITNSALPTFAVAFDNTKTQGGDIIEVRRGSTVLGTATLDATQASIGTVNVTLTTALTSGANTLSAVQRDAAGNSITGTATLAVTRDSTVPKAAAVTGYTATTINGTTEANATLLLSTSATAPTSFASSTATADATGNYTLDISSLAGSSVGTTYSLYAQDAAGNVSLTSNQKVVVGTSGDDLLSGLSISGSDLLVGGSGTDTAQYAVASNAIAYTGQITAATVTAGSINIGTANIDVLTAIEQLTFSGTGYTGIGTGTNQLRSTVQSALANNTIAEFTGTYNAGSFTFGGANPNATLLTFDSNSGTATNYEAVLLLGKTTASGSFSLAGGTVSLKNL